MFVDGLIDGEQHQRNSSSPDLAQIVGLHYVAGLKSSKNGKKSLTSSDQCVCVAVCSGWSEQDHVAHADTHSSRSSRQALHVEISLRNSLSLVL